MAAFRTFWNSPVGPKTTHFWGPIANFSFVVAGLADTQKPPDMISGNMTGVMCIYSALFMRFAWVVQPRNYLLMACHVSNETVQLYQLSRWFSAHGYLPKKEEPEKKWMLLLSKNCLSFPSLAICHFYFSFKTIIVDDENIGAFAKILTTCVILQWSNKIKYRHDVSF